MKAAIDIGTNTLLLLVVDEHSQRVVDLCRFGRLGQGLDASGRLARAAITRSLEICREYRGLLDAHGVTPRIVATQALREAANADEFRAPAEAILGAPIEIIDGMREAELAFLSVARTFPELAGEPYTVVDVGGGSTEIIISDGSVITSATSVPIGAVRLYERHLRSDPPTAAELAALDADIARHLPELPADTALVATAGTATTIAAIELGLESYDPDAVTGLRLAPEQVAATDEMLRNMTIAQRRATAGIEPERADVIVAGVAIYAQAAARARVMITCDRGVRWGLVFEQP
jgi:exopolyphosphatase/guanosine-5'-triphosphate,3'-diphosphate pyrophosphatase